jgi:L-ribulose-5-phosphate 4-epimerase
MDIAPLGTTHADYFHGPIPCTRELYSDEVASDYELNTGKVIAETFESRRIDPLAVPAALVANHGPFAWGKDAMDAVFHAVVIEHVAEMAMKTLALNPQSRMESYVLDKHYLRKHGPNAYYGQV